MNVICDDKFYNMILFYQIIRLPVIFKMRKPHISMRLNYFALKTSIV